MYSAKAYSAASATLPLAHTRINRRDPTEHDVQIEILFRGICHSDLHHVRNITADVEVIPVQKVNEACERLVKSAVKYRFSIDMGSMKSE